MRGWDIITGLTTAEPQQSSGNLLAWKAYGARLRCKMFLCF